MWQSRPYIFQVRCHLTLDTADTVFIGTVQCWWFEAAVHWFSEGISLNSVPWWVVLGYLDSWAPTSACAGVSCALSFAGLDTTLWLQVFSTPGARWRPGSLGHLGVSCLYPWLFFSISFCFFCFSIPSYPNMAFTSCLHWRHTLIIMWIMK